MGMFNVAIPSGSKQRHYYTKSHDLSLPPKIETEISQKF